MNRALPLSASLCIALSLVGLAQAETKVVVSNTHLCCPACVAGVKTALKDVPGVKHECDEDAHTISLTAENDDAAQKGIDALAAAGFHGKLDSDKFKFQPVKAPEGKVERLELTGIHNCCGACTSAIKKSLGTVEGVTANTVKSKQTTFVVEGKFSAAAVIEALLDSGFHVQVKQ
jgi:mercuric ion binding protein